ncbi:MAG: response regulator [Bdellovibrionota bacterium]
MNCIMKIRRPQACSVLVIESISSIRQLFIDSLKDIGFERIVGFANGKDALHFMEVEHIDLAIMPFAMQDGTNAIHFLKIITENPTLRDTRISIFIDPTTEDYILPLAFELGLLSWHQKSFIRDDIQEEIKKLLEVAQSHDWNGVLTSAFYLRSFLKEKNYKNSLLALEQSILKFRPGSTVQLLNLADALFRSGHEEKGLIILKQCELIDERTTPLCESLIELHHLDIRSHPSQYDISSMNALGIKIALIVDSDIAVLSQCEKLLTAVGVKKILTFENGQKAIDWIESSADRPELVLTEWKLPGLTGPILIQRLRKAGLVDIPIIAISSLIQSSDFPILKEIGVDDCIEKPFGKTDFFKKIVWTLQENKCPKEHKSLQFKISRLLQSGSRSEAERLMSQLFSDDRLDDTIRKEIEIEYLFTFNKFEEVCHLGVDIVEKGYASLKILNMVGKSLLELKKYDLALQYLEKASEISPINIDRLLNLTQISMKMENLEIAELHVLKAESLDPKNPEVLEMKCKVHIEADKVDEAQELMYELDSGLKIASFMNTSAVSLIKNGRFEKGIALYHKTIKSIPLIWREKKLAVQYNLALALAKYGNLKESLEILHKIDQPPQYFTSSKIISLKKKIETSINTGMALELKTSQCEEIPIHDLIEEESISDNYEEISVENTTHLTRSNHDTISIDDLISNLNISVGDICCYLLFYFIENEDKEEGKLLDKLPIFKPRLSIKI